MLGFFRIFEGLRIKIQIPFSPYLDPRKQFNPVAIKDLTTGEPLNGLCFRAKENRLYGM